MTAQHSNTPVIHCSIPPAVDHRDPGLLEGRCHQYTGEHYEPRKFA
jgi:hypothetical protein